MPETKTFKNVFVSDGGLGITLYKRPATDSFSPLGNFLNREWDMEITFTRKPRPIAVGDKVRFTKNRMSSGTVLAIYTAKDGLPDRRWAWVEWKDLPPSTCRLGDLEHAEPES